jgi:hypothetical protein
MQDGRQALIVKARSMIVLQEHGADLFYFADTTGVYKL